MSCESCVTFVTTNLWFLRSINLITFIFSIFCNVYFGQFSGPYSIGEVSDLYVTYLTPAGPAFTIWSLIYILLFGFEIWQFIPTLPNERVILPLSLWFSTLNICNGVWMILFVQGTMPYMWACLVLLIIIVAILAVIQIRVNLWNRLIENDYTCADSAEIIFTELPFSVYFGWTVLALLLNLTTALKASEVDEVSSEIWACCCLTIALAIMAYQSLGQYNFVFCLVLVWASAWIYIANDECQSPEFNPKECELTKWFALSISVIAFLFAVAGAASFGHRFNQTESIEGQSIY